MTTDSPSLKDFLKDNEFFAKNRIDARTINQVF